MAIDIQRNLLFVNEKFRLEWRSSEVRWIGILMYFKWLMRETTLVFGMVFEIHKILKISYRSYLNHGVSEKCLQIQ